MVLAIDVTTYLSNPWIPSLPTPRDSSYLSDIKTIKITSDPSNRYGDNHIIFKTEFVNSMRKAISFDRVSYYSSSPSDFSYQGFSAILESVEIGSVETLCFDRYPVDANFAPLDVTPALITQELRKFQNLKTLILAKCNITLFLDWASSCSTVDTLIVYSTHDPFFGFNGPPVQELAASRKKAGCPLKTVTLVYPFEQPRLSELEELASCVGSVKVVSREDARSWNIDEYLLAAATRGDNLDRP